MPKRILALATSLVVLGVSTAEAMGLGISPGKIEFPVYLNGKTHVEFLIFDFSGDLEVILIDIPLEVEPKVIHVDAIDKPQKITLTFYGDESREPQIFKGMIGFRGMTGGNIGIQVNVLATIDHAQKPPPHGLSLGGDSE